MADDGKLHVEELNEFWHTLGNSEDGTLDMQKAVEDAGLCVSCFPNEQL